MANIVFVAYANSPEDRHLPALEGEHDALKGQLMPLDSKEYIKLVRAENSSTAEFLQVLGLYSGQITLLHFSGHAGAQAIELADGAANASGMGQILAGNLKDGQQQLRLVFLNGCATAGQVQAFHDAGVPAVIATSVPVFDRVAARFSEAFYRALTNKRSIVEAFNFAVGELKLLGGEIPSIELRGPVSVSQDDGEGLPWGLYARQGDLDAIHWHLPYSRESGLSQQLHTDIQTRAANNNKYLVRVLDPMCRVNKDIVPNYLVQEVNGQERPVDPSRYLDAVIENFPWVIGSQIRLLRQKTQSGRERLEQLVSTYIISSQVAYYLLLSDCWQQKMRSDWELKVAPGFTLPPKSVEELKDLDFSARLLEVYRFMAAHKSTFFAPELGDFCKKLADPAHRLYKANQVLVEMRQQLAQNMPGDWATSCERAEKALAVFLSELAFLAGYHFLTVRNISLDFAYTKPLAYDLEMGKLNALAADSLSIYQDSGYRRKERYANSKSIILTPNEHDLQFALPLAPFVIDRNTYLQDPLPHLFLFAYAEGNRYYYYSVDHDFFTAIAGGKGFDLIHTEWCREDFKEGGTDISVAADEDDWQDDPFASGSSVSAPSAKTPIFVLLEEQHARFRSDFAPYQNPANP